MKRVFVSYCREDGGFADNLRRTLEEAGIPTWVDTDLRGGQSWRAEIDLAIRESLALVVVMSAEAAKSEYVAYEWAFALGVGVNVVPVLLKIAPEDLHPALKSRHCLDFTSQWSWDLLTRAVKGIAPPGERTTILVPPNAPPVLEHAVRALDSMDESQREAALDTLKSMTHPSVNEVLAAAMNHPIQEVRRRAVGMLLKRGDQRCLPAVLRSCRRQGWGGSEIGPYRFMSTGWGVDIEALAALGVEAAPDLIAALGSESDGARGAAAETLGVMHNREAIPHLKRLLADPDECVRASAWHALGQFNDPALLPIFQEEFRKDQEPLWALHIAAQLPDSGGESLLIEGLEHSHPGVRRWAADLLEPVATAASIDALRRAAKGTESGVRQRAIAALSRVDGAGQVDIFLDALEDEDSSVRDAAREALGKAGRLAAARLIEIMRSPDRMYRVDAARLLGQVADDSAIPALCEALREADTGEAAAESLGKLAKPGMPAVATLEQLALEGNGSMREAARRALCEIADPATIGTLSQILDDEDKYARNRAEAALERIRKPEAQRALAEWRRKNKKG